MSDPAAIRAFEHAAWEQAADMYESSFATATRAFVPALLDAAAVRAGDTVLDVACGPGVVTAAAVERGAGCRGLDFSASMLRVARASHPGIAFDQGDAEALPYPDTAFDGVVSNFGMHHVPRPEVALRQARRVLRPGRRLAFTVWAPPAENAAWRLVFDAVRRCGDMGASKAPAPGGGFRGAEDCRQALATAGFEAIGCARLDAVWQHADARALLEALRSGTARMAALIAAQPVSALEAMIADIEHSAAPFREGTGLAVPIVAYVAQGRRPAG